MTIRRFTFIAALLALSAAPAAGQWREPPPAWSVVAPDSAAPPLATASARPRGAKGAVIGGVAGAVLAFVIFVIPAESNDRPSIVHYLLPVAGALIGYGAIGD
ncbi:MAG TPA: hypothetical protein VF625_14770 [Longimicrobium sp.]|jgi:hypothetical protein